MGSQHQKIVVIDNAIAFTGGLDLTIERLDNSEHCAEANRRVTTGGKHYPPHHDVQVAVDGPAAVGLAREAEERWYSATGENLKPVKPSGDVWPESLTPDMRRVDIAIARSYPSLPGRAAVREIETLYLDAIRTARQSIYIENQYFTSERVAEALCNRLKEPDGPEVILVLPRDRFGWLEKKIIEAKEFRTLARLKEANLYGRLGIFAPVNGGAKGTAIKVHAKVMIIDGCYVQVGSANLADRSMGIDSECDIATVSPTGSQAAAVSDFRNRLLAEHLGHTSQDVGWAIGRHKSLLKAIEALRGGERTLIPYPMPEKPPAKGPIDTDRILDPDAPFEFERMKEETDGEVEPEDESARFPFLWLFAAGVVVLGLAAMWRWGPLSTLADPSFLINRIQTIRSDIIAIGFALSAFVLGGLIMFPLNVMIVATSLLFGPFIGIAVAWTGAIASALAGYAVGASLGQRSFQRLAGARAERISRRIAQHGVLSVVLLRLVPIGPFSLVNMIAGSSHISLRDFLLGSAIGLAPGVLAITLFADQVGEVFQDPSAGSFAWLAVILAGIALGGGLLWHLVNRMKPLR
ncbi:MAG: VTT domain-containing protein [Rhodobacteraceae bacterium]|uniref:VTT domain-containing protein n=1 Tax=Marivita sp. TaxID=2003365 RepID=UPI003B525DEA|nr:VTT domain-containing protein [Paracoccaceae bacterium]